MKTVMKKILIMFFLLCFSILPGVAAAVTIHPVHMTGLRSFDDGANVNLLSFTAVKKGTEDRTIAHYDITGLSGTVTSAFLDLSIYNLDGDDPEGILEMYSFVGDGTVSTDEWELGSLYHTFTDIDGETSILTAEITSLLQIGLDDGDDFLSFNFRGGNYDRYSNLIGSITASTEDSAAPVPEPTTMLLLGIGLMGLTGFGRKLKKQ